MEANFKNDTGLLPAIIQDHFTKNVLMLGYMNKEALEKTLKTGKITFFSRSRNTLWTKGETSGNFLEYVSHHTDCDQDTLLFQAIPVGPTCHTNNDTCFGTYPNKGTDLGFLENIIQDRKANPKEGSYTNQLLSNPNKAAQKVGEEAVELVIEAKDNNDELFLNEAADLMYHYLVLLTQKDKTLDEVIGVLKERFNK